MPNRKLSVRLLAGGSQWQLRALEAREAERARRERERAIESSKLCAK